VGGLYSVAFDPRGRWLATVGGDNTVKLWDLKTQKELASGGCDNAYLCPPLFARDAKTPALFLANHDRTVKRWKIVEIGEEVRLEEKPPLKGHTETAAVRIVAAAIAADGTLVTAAKNPNDNSAGEIARWNLAEGKLIEPPQKLPGSVVGLTLSPDGQKAVWQQTAHQRSDVVLWDVAKGTQLDAIPNNPYLSNRGRAISPDGKRLAWGDGGVNVLVWDMSSNPPARLATYPAHPKAGVNAVAIARGGRKVASLGSDHTVVIWNVDTGKQLAAWAMPGYVAEYGPGLAFSADGKFLATANGNGTAYVFRVP
jgi:WD40 repeat protein